MISQRHVANSVFPRPRAKNYWRKRRPVTTLAAYQIKRAQHRRPITRTRGEVI